VVGGKSAVKDLFMPRWRAIIIYNTTTCNSCELLLRCWGK
jgi:hypothetical protein